MLGEQPQDQVEPYESWLSREPHAGLEDASRFFENGGRVRTALRTFVDRLDRAGIAYAVAGGIALFRYGYRRFTPNIDILVTAEGLRAIRDNPGAFCCGAVSPGTRTLRDAETGVRIQLLVAGAFPGDGKPMPVAFPHPEAVAEAYEGIRYVNLPVLFELKLASGMTNPGRMKDLADVLELIQAIKLPPEFADRLNPFVQDKFRELWALTQAGGQDL